MTQVENYQYEIDDENVIRVWDLNNTNEENKPFLYQPVKPEGEAWADKAEAETWVNNYIQELLKPAPVEDAEIVEEVTE